MSEREINALVTAIGRVGTEDHNLIPRTPGFTRKLAEMIATDFEGNYEISRYGYVEFNGTDLEEILGGLRSDLPFYFAR